MACDSPLSIKYNPPIPDGKGGFIYYFPADCGKCLPCLKKRKNQWSWRLVEEQRNSFSAYFVTLTYDDNNLIESYYNGNEYDHKQFIKELKRLEKSNKLAQRDSISEEEYKRAKNMVGTTEVYKDIHGNERVMRKPLKYYGVIELGEQRGRPHYHYILFNVVDKYNIKSAWNKGIVQIDECNINTIDYVLKYMLKSEDERKGEKSFMSKGLGDKALDKELIKHVKSMEGNFLLSQRNNKVPLPRYYRKKYLTEEETKQKNAYIAEVMRKKQEQEDNIAEIYGFDPEQNRQMAKELRYKKLLEQEKRKL